MYYVYVIYNKKHKKIYIGQCENVPIRLDQHNNKFFNKCYTTRFDGNWELIHKEECNTRVEALKREKQLKSYRGREFLKIKYSAIASATGGPASGGQWSNMFENCNIEY